MLLTPGPYNETYFEHAYLARYLGFTLVEGADLTVRDSRVFLKTSKACSRSTSSSAGSTTAFAIRWSCGGDSFLGVPGLVDAVRAGNVVVANALGSGVIETAAILPFLPGLCRDLLGEELLLPSVATWWCGQPAHLSLRPGASRPTWSSSRRFRPRRQDPLFGRKLSRARTKRAGDGDAGAARGLCRARRTSSSRPRRCGTARPGAETDRVQDLRGRGRGLASR